MALAPFCPNPYAAGTPWGGLHGHMSRPIWDTPEYRGARWAHDPFSTHCCELCDLRHSIPDISHIFSELSLYDPYRHAALSQMYEGIHEHIVLGYDRDGSESYYLSREAEKLARELMRLSRRSPWGGRGLSEFASGLKYMGREMQVGRRRSRYHTVPRPRYWEGGFGYGYGDSWRYDSY